MKGLHALGRILEASVKRKGEVPLTNAHLLNIVKLAVGVENARDEAIERSLNEMMGEDLKWGKD